MTVEWKICNFLNPITSSVSGLLFWRIWLLDLSHYLKNVDDIWEKEVHGNWTISK